MVPPFGAGFLYIGSGAVGGICHMYAVGVDCCFFLMIIVLSDVCDDDSKNQNHLLLFLVCLDSLFSKDSRVKYHELLSPRSLSFNFSISWVFNITHTIHVWCIYIYRDKHGWYGLQ